MTGYDSKTLSRAKALRRKLTDSERVLWKRLRNRQISNAKLRRQQPIGPFITDFVCQEHLLVIELDGSQHVDNEKDRRHDTWLRSKGYRVLRFWNNDVSENIDGVLTAIVRALSDGPSPTSTIQQADKSSYPLPQRERRVTP